MKLPSRTEELILLAVWRLEENAYGITIRRYLKEEAGIDYSIGGIYVPLERLVSKGMLSSRQGDPTPARGGMSKRYFQLTAEGVAVLRDIRALTNRLWDNLPDIVFHN